MVGSKQVRCGQRIEVGQSVHGETLAQALESGLGRHPADERSGDASGRCSRSSRW